MNRHLLVRALALGVLFLFSVGCENAARKREIENAQAQVRRIAADLDRRTTDTGVYIRVKEDEIVENDPWDTRVMVSYSQGGIAEIVSVRSAGPDKLFHSNDDLVAQKSTTNFKGVGEGIKKNTEETAMNAGKGLVKGVVSGVKESVKDVLPSKKKDDTTGAAADPTGEDKAAGSETPK